MGGRDGEKRAWYALHAHARNVTIRWLHRILQKTHSCFYPDNRKLIREEAALFMLSQPDIVLLSAIPISAQTIFFPWFLTGLGKVSLLCFWASDFFTITQKGLLLSVVLARVAK